MRLEILITAMRSIPINHKRVSDICERNNIVFLGMFGSHARGDSDSRSDIDLLARFSTSKSLLDLVRIQRALAQRLKKPVDLLTEGSISPYLIERIKTEIKIIYEKER